MEQPTVNINTLATLARIAVPEDNKAHLATDIGNIMSLLDMIAKVDVHSAPVTPTLHNIMREDTGAHDSGIHTDELINAAAHHAQRKVIVKQVVSRG